MIEVFKYDKLMSLDKDIVKLYFVSDPKGSYMFYLNELNDLSKESLSCPKNTMWNGAKTNKDVYLLSEDRAIMKQQFNTKLFYCMPLLRPKKYEKNKDFIQRCMGNAKMGEFSDRDQRYSVCQTIFKDQFNPKK